MHRKGFFFFSSNDKRRHSFCWGRLHASNGVMVLGAAQLILTAVIVATIPFQFEGGQKRVLPWLVCADLAVIVGGFCAVAAVWAVVAKTPGFLVPSMVATVIGAVLNVGVSVFLVQAVVRGGSYFRDCFGLDLRGVEERSGMDHALFSTVAVLVIVGCSAGLLAGAFLGLTVLSRCYRYLQEAAAFADRALSDLYADTEPGTEPLQPPRRF